MYYIKQKTDYDCTPVAYVNYLLAVGTLGWLERFVGWMDCLVGHGFYQRWIDDYYRTLFKTTEEGTDEEDANEFISQVSHRTIHHFREFVRILTNNNIKIITYLDDEGEWHDATIVESRDNKLGPDLLVTNVEYEGKLYRKKWLYWWDVHSLLFREDSEGRRGYIWDMGVEYNGN